MSSSKPINTVPSLIWNSELETLDALTDSQVQHLANKGVDSTLGAYNTVKVKFNVKIGDKLHHDVEFKVSYSQQNGIKTSLASYFAKSELKEVGTQLRTAYNGAEYWSNDDKLLIDFDNEIDDFHVDNKITCETVGYLGVYEGYELIENDPLQSDTPCVGSVGSVGSVGKSEPEKQSLKTVSASASASASVNGDESVTDNDGANSFILEHLTEQDKEEIAKQEQLRKEVALVDDLNSVDLHQLLVSKCVTSTPTFESVPTDKKRSDSNTSDQDHQLVSTFTEDVYKRINEGYDNNVEESNSEVTQSLTSAPHKADSESFTSDDTSGLSASISSNELDKTEENKNTESERIITNRRKKKKTRKTRKKKGLVVDSDGILIAETGNGKHKGKDLVTPLNVAPDKDFHDLLRAPIPIENKLSQGEPQDEKLAQPPVSTTSTNLTTNTVQQSSPLNIVTNLIDIGPKLHLRKNNLLIIFRDKTWSKQQIERGKFIGSKKVKTNCSEIVNSWTTEALNKDKKLKIICIDKEPLVASSYFEDLGIDMHRSVTTPVDGDVQVSLSQSVCNSYQSELKKNENCAVRVICDSQLVLEELAKLLSSFDFKGYRVTGKL